MGYRIRAGGGVEDMSFWNSRYIKKSRKDHTCQFCGCKIETGSGCWSETGTFEGDFNNYHLCERCKHVIQEYPNLFTDEYDNYLMEFLECLRESDLLNCPKCGKRSMREYEWSNKLKQQLDIECDNCDHKYTVDLSIEGIDKVLGIEWVEGYECLND